MDTLAGVLYGMSHKDDKVKLRVPLSVIIDYKGFRCLAIAKMPVKGNQGPLLGFYESNYWNLEEKIYESFKRVGEELNLKHNYTASTKR